MNWLVGRIIENIDKTLSFFLFSVINFLFVFRQQASDAIFNHYYTNN